MSTPKHFRLTLAKLPAGLLVLTAMLLNTACNNRSAPTVTPSGNAALDTDGSYSLTFAKPDQTGGLFRKQPLALSSFSSEVAFQLTGANGSSDDCDGGRPGGEGLAFVITTKAPTSPGTGGSGLGYQGLSDSLTVEFDSACSKANSDPKQPHIAIDRNGSVSHGGPNESAAVEITDAKTGTSFDDGAVWTAWIDYAAGKLEVRLARDGQRPQAASLNADVPAAMVESRYIWLGFTGATGRGAAQQTLLRWRLRWGIPQGSNPPGPPPVPKLEVLIPR